MWGSKRNRGKREEPSSPADLRMKLSGASSGEKGDGKSSKGSRSPPSVFKRLGSQGTTTPGFTQSIEDSRTSKKRRLSSSDERNPKKARRNSSEKKKVFPSVFQRLGETRCDNEGNNQEEAHHSALVAVTTPVHSANMAAKVPVHSVQRIALESGYNLKEGLMGNTNPSRSI